MKLSSWCLLAASAVLYAVPLIIPHYAWWIAFLFPIPLFYVATQEDLGFKVGFIWGLIAISAHLSGVLLGIDSFTGAGDGWARLIPAIGLLSYSGLCTALIFWLSNCIKKWFALATPAAIIALWTATLWCYIFFFDRLCLFPFSCFEGYFGFHPIVALAVHPQLLTLIPFIGKNLLALCMYLVPATITLFFVQPNRRNAILIAFALLPWIISICIPIPPAHKPAWLDRVVALPASFTKMGGITEQATLAQHYFRMIEQGDTLREVILMPESSFYGDHLSTAPELCKLWAEDHLGKPMHIILGSFRWDGPYFRNSLHWIYNGKLKTVFDKRHCMALLERVPNWINYPTIHHLFFKTGSQISPSQKARPIFQISDAIVFTPYICSELFFNEHPDDTHPTIPILATTNDSWCFNLYVAELMHLDARLKAIMWQRDIAYISFKYAVYIDKYGNETAITRITEI